MNYEVSLPIGVVIALVLTIVMYVKIMPRKLDGTFDHPFKQFLHDYFHFKKLYLEEVLKWIFALATIACVVCGLLLLISAEKYGRRSYSTFWYGVALLAGGPISLRLAYETVMMFILLVKNVMEINSKLKAPAEEIKEEPKDEPEAEQE